MHRGHRAGGHQASTIVINNATMLTASATIAKNAHRGLRYEKIDVGGDVGGDVAATVKVDNEDIATVKVARPTGESVRCPIGETPCSTVTLAKIACA